MIRRTDKLVKVLKAQPELVDVLQGLSPALRGLRSPAVRKVMGALMTVEQAARTAGLDADELVERLERASREEDSGVQTAGLEGLHPTKAALPQELATISGERIVELDVRDDLRSGKEPFSTIMLARARVPDGGALSLRVTFEPVPLYAVLEKHGFVHHAVQLGDEDWQVWFYRDAGDAQRKAAVSAVAPTAPTGVQERTSVGDDVVILDVRNLEPPEPMVRTLAALEVLPPQATLVHINERVPKFLLPQLEDRGFEFEIEEQEPGLIRVFIRRPR